MAIHRQVPNIITVVRIFFAPIFLWLLLIDAGENTSTRWFATALFVFAISTDWVDGYLARRYDVVTNLGKILDPIADKVLTGCAFLGLSLLAELPWWITVLVLVREWGITIYRLIVVSNHVLAAAWMGKLKTVAQAVALGFALAPLAMLGSWVHVVNIVLMSIAVVLTVASGLDYVISEIRGARSRRK